MASLSDNPLEAEFEDYVAAHIASRGMFVETGVTERDPRDVLELDVVWTDYRNLPPVRNAMELKSKGWGLGDFFRFCGWLKYIGITEASFVFRGLPDQTPIDLMNRLGAKVGIRPVHLEDLSTTDERLAGLGLPPIAGESLPQVWRYSFWTQRRLLFALSKAVEKKVCPEAAKAAKDAAKLFNDAVFFEPDVGTRAAMLLEEHLKKRYLASAAALEIEGKPIDFDTNVETATFKSALYKGAHIPVQSCLFVSHRGRLAALKAAVDYVLQKHGPGLPKKVINILGREYDISELELHGAFKSVIGYLEKQNTTPRYAIFWQQFLWAWGGFILLDKKDEEYAALSAETGVPVTEIDAALACFDILFPRASGKPWLATHKGDNRLLLALMPAAMRGVGAFARLLRYGKKEHHELGLTGDYTWRDLASDQNAAARLLSNDDAELIK